MDTLSEILRPMRLVSSLISRARFTAPWAVRTSGVRGAVFHVVTSGECCLHDEPSGTRVRLARGDLVLLSHGGPHTVSDAPGTGPAVRVADLPVVGGGARVEFGGAGPATTVLCGSFRLDHSAGAALLAALPRFVHVSRGDSGVADWFDVTLSMVDREVDRGRPGTGAVVARMLDVLFVELLRSAAASLPHANAGWLAAVRDERVGRALAAIHNEPGGRWTLNTLARKAGMSRTVFCERFTALVGESPARYLARWRVLAAADQLRHTDVDLDALAADLGYGSVAAFGRTFKRYLALTPGEFRKAIAAGVDPSEIGSGLLGEGPGSSQRGGTSEARIVA